MILPEGWDICGVSLEIVWKKSRSAGWRAGRDGLPLGKGGETAGRCARGSEEGRFPRGNRLLLKIAGAFPGGEEY